MGNDQDPNVTGPSMKEKRSRVGKLIALANNSGVADGERENAYRAIGKLVCETPIFISLLVTRGAGKRRARIGEVSLGDAFLGELVRGLFGRRKRRL